VVIPTDEQVRALHEKYAPTPEAFEVVHTHCEIVCRIAEQIADRNGLGVDMDLVRAGCLLHDIGVYRLYDAEGRLDHARYVRHGLLGHRLLTAEGLPEVVCRFCSCHTGVGLTRDDVRRQRLPLPVADYLAVSGEEVLVMYADKFHSKTEPPTFVTAATYTKAVSRYGQDKAALFEKMRATFGEPDLAALASTYGHAVV
jgi:uncharacterized protein